MTPNSVKLGCCGEAIRRTAGGENLAERERDEARAGVERLKTQRPYTVYRECPYCGPGK